MFAFYLNAPRIIPPRIKTMEPMTQRSSVVRDPAPPINLIRQSSFPPRQPVFAAIPVQSLFGQIVMLFLYGPCESVHHKPPRDRRVLSLQFAIGSLLFYCQNRAPGPVLEPQFCLRRLLFSKTCRNAGRSGLFAKAFQTVLSAEERSLLIMSDLRLSRPSKK